jgi:hypothetical protein
MRCEAKKRKRKEKERKPNVLQVLCEEAKRVGKFDQLKSHSLSGAVLERRVTLVGIENKVGRVCVLNI